MNEASSSPADHVVAIEATCRRIETPCGDGHMVWRSWGSGPPLILLHGGFGSWNHWIRNIKPLAEHYEVIAADLPGLGDSAVAPRPYNADTIGAILAEGLEQILADRRPCHMVCFSFGAAVGSVAAALIGDKLASFTSAGGAGYGPRDHVIEGLQRVLPEMEPEERRDTVRGNLAALMMSDPANIDELAIYLHDENTRRARTRSRPISLTDCQLQALPKMQGQVNVIWGSLDITIQGMLQQRTDAILAARPDARIIMLDGIGHWTQYEGADRFNQTLLETLRS